MIKSEFHYNTEFGVVHLKEFSAPYSAQAIDEILKIASMNIRKENAENYSNDFTDPSSLAFLLKQNSIQKCWLLYVNDEFQFFSSIRIVDDDFICLVRTFSSISGIKKPFHLCFILPRQIQYALKLGFKEAIYSINVGVRENLVETVQRRFYKHHGPMNSIKTIGINFLVMFKYDGIAELNYCQQHIFRADLTQPLPEFFVNKH